MKKKILPTSKQIQPEIEVCEHRLIARQAVNFKSEYGCDYLQSLKQAVAEELEFYCGLPDPDPQVKQDLENLLAAVCEELEFCLGA